jgi:hypothetical protein
MLTILGLLGTALTGGTIANLLDGDDAVHGTHGTDEMDVEQDGDSVDLLDDDGGDEAGAQGSAEQTGEDGSDIFVRAVDDGPEAWFDDFTPGQDTLVVTYPDGDDVPQFSDLVLSYDAEFDETEVTLNTAAGTRLICYLPDVAPEDVTPGSVEFMSFSEASAALSAD